MTTGQIRILAISIACMVCAGVVDSAAAQPQAAHTTYMFCLSHPSPPDTSYFSGIFVMDPSTDGDAQAWNAAIERERRSGGHGPNPGPAPWVAQFDRFITQRDPRNPRCMCSGFNTLAEAQKRMAEVIQSERNFKYKVVETGWAYGSSAIAPAASAAPVAPAPVVAATVAPAQPAHPARTAAATPAQTPYAVCWGETAGANPAAYFSVPFEAPVKNTPAWYKSYREALKEKYGRASAGPLRCNTLKSLAEAQTYLQTTMDKLRATHKIIETGWKYE